MYKGSMTKIADAAQTIQYLLVVFGSDADHIAVCDGTAAPTGTCPDTPAAGEITAVLLLGCADESRTMVASGAIDVDVDVFADADGKIQALPVAAGTYYCVGKALEAAAADLDEIQVDPCKPYPVVVT